MRRPIPALGLVTALVVIAACSDTTTPPDQPEPPTGPAAITGVVKDVDGNPVANAAVVVDLDMVQPTALATDKPSTALTFHFTEATSFAFTITDACDDEVFMSASLADVPPGTYTINWTGTDQDGLRLSEGLFRYHLQPEGQDPVAGDLVLARNRDDQPGEFATIPCLDVWRTWRLDAMTDAAGRFTIAKDCWDFGRSSTATDETGAVIGRMDITSRVRVWVYAQERSYGFAGDWGTFDAERGVSFAVTMPPAADPAP